MEEVRGGRGGELGVGRRFLLGLACLEERKGEGEPRLGVELEVVEEDEGV